MTHVPTHPEMQPCPVCKESAWVDEGGTIHGPWHAECYEPDNHIVSADGDTQDDLIKNWNAEVVRVKAELVSEKRTRASELESRASRLRREADELQTK